MTKAPTANVSVTTDNANKRIRISYNEGGAQTIDVNFPANIEILERTISFSKSGEAGATETITIGPSNPRSVCVETSGYAHAC